MISIIVPVYHVENELRRCLDSILAQSYKEFELILINDGGNEVETAICEQYAEQDKRIIYRHQNNQGLSAARNHGLELSRGEWIMFVDSDDWVNEEFCRKAYEAVNVSCAQMAIFDLAYTQGNERSGTVHASQIEAGIYPSEEILRLRLSGKIQGYAWNKIYNRSLWKGIRFPEKELWEDDAVMHELIDAAKQIAVIHDVLYYKPYRAECITSIAKENGEENKWLFIQRKRRYLYLKEHHPEMMDTECNVTALSALLYARYLSGKKDDKAALSELHQWVRQEKIMLNKQSWIVRMAYRVWYYCPDLFRIVMKTIG